MWHIVLFGALPIPTTIGSQFPEVRRFLLAWVSPLYQAVVRG